MEITFFAIVLGVFIWISGFASFLLLRRKIQPFIDSGLKGGFLYFAASFLLVLIIRLIVAAYIPEDKSLSLSIEKNLLLIAIIQAIVYLAGICVIAFSQGRDGLKNVGLTMRQPLVLLGFGIFGYVALYPSYIFGCLINHLIFGSEPQEIVKEILLNPELMQSVSVVFCTGLIIPVLEEIAFRGFLHSGLKVYLSPTLSILITAVLFALMHEYQAAIPVFALGCILGYLREHAGSLFPSIVVHVVHNSLMLLLLPNI